MNVYTKRVVSTTVWTLQVKNKTGTSKVGAISKAQKAQKTFKKLEIFDFFLSENVA